jgi:signal transduction histidine kinase
VIVAVGFGLAAVAAGVGTALLRSRLGATPEAMAERVEAAIRTRLDASAAELAALSRRVAAHQDLISDAPDDASRAPDLFTALSVALPDRLRATTGVTVFDAARTPIAWVGRVFEFPANQPDGPGSVFVQADPFGPRLVRIEALIDREKGVVTRPPLIVAEQRLGDVRLVPGQPTTFIMQTDLAPVTVDVQEEAPDESTTPANAYPFAVRLEGGQLLLRGSVAHEDLARTRRDAQSTLRAIVALVVALSLLAVAASVLEFRRSVRQTASVLAASFALAILLVFARTVLWAGGGFLSRGGWFDPPIDLTLTALMSLALVWLTLDLIERWRVDRRRPLRTQRSRTWTVATGTLAGAVTVALLSTYADLLRRFTAAAAFDPLHFSLHPFDVPRVLSACGLVVLHAAAVWGAAALTRAVFVARRRPRTLTLAWVDVLSWSGGAAVMAALVYRWSPDLTTAELFFPTAAAAAAAAVLRSPRGRFRRGSQAARLGMLYAALVGPALSVYPLLHGFAAGVKEELIARQYGPMAASQRDDLKQHLARTLEQIDARPSLSVGAVSRSQAIPDAQPAFEIWRSTDLERYRLTSAIELYGPNLERGRPISRFSLRLPQTSLESPLAWGCEWDFVDEVSPIGSSERHVLRASRAFCDRGRRVGAIVVRVMLDYRTLPFIWAESPYMASLGPGREASVEATPGHDIAFVGYGWSGAPLTTSGVVVWPLSDQVFARLTASREPLWQSIAMPDDTRYRVHFLSDQGGIYALGYPVISPLGHLVNVAELVVLVSIVYLALLLGATIASSIASGGLSGRGLLREVRSSFYRKLVVAFVLSAAVPVLVLAIATSTYFSAQAQAGVAAEAVKTVTVAQRLVEDYAQLDPSRRRALDDLDDQTMVIVGRAIDQPVNLFERERLRATSERDLYASALLTPRTPSDVFRRIVLERQPAFVGEEEVNGSPYLVAAAPVRAGDREGVVTVPQTLRQREIEAQIDELNRRVVFAAVLFAVLAAGFGYWMAERIADPVNRLTRATRRIARGDLDARIATTSSDELRRLVEDFNHMAADLKRQRSELERTQRLEAWADMARQVAHDIKNPLTPIQLSAEHAQRINTDRGKPLSPVLDECVQVILGQVRLLRQISAEFSSFASSPTARPEPTDIVQLIEEVALPYRAALASRTNPIQLTTSGPADVPALALDRTLFARALTNIIENAVHAMPSGGRLSIEMSRVPVTAEYQEHVLVRIADTGIGMEPDAVARIFEPYFSTKAAGTGLGLTIAKRNVELNRGRIEVTSQRGVGTTVSIRIPL